MILVVLTFYLMMALFTVLFYYAEKKYSSQS